MSINRQYNSTNFITGMRAIAILMVFLIHSGGLGLKNLGHAANNLVNWGAYGVEMFFVISGFTIFYQFLESNYDFKKFLFIRISRISIPYYPLLILIFVYLHFGGEQFNAWATTFNHGIVSVPNLITHIFYVNSYKLGFANSILGVEWTIGIEVFFYLFFAILITSNIFNLNKTNLIIIFIIFLIISIFSYIASDVKHLVNSLYIHWLPFPYGSMFLLGGFSYQIRKKIELKLEKSMQKLISNICIVIIPIVTILVLFSSIANNDFYMQFYFATITFIAITLIRDNAFLSKLLTNPVILFLGSISYSFYLWHFFVLNFMHNTINPLLLFVFSIAISSFWYWLFEKNLYGRIKAKGLRLNPYTDKKPAYNQASSNYLPQK